MLKKILIFLLISLFFYYVIFAQKNNENKILSIGKKMVDDGVVVKGSCWGYINKIYNTAGYPNSRRKTVFKTDKKSGKYADVDLVQPGDWLYYINHSYHDVEHSGIFVKWVDKRNKIGEILSYAGQNIKSPGRYRNYKLDTIYTIIRPDDVSERRKTDKKDFNEAKEVLKIKFKKGKCPSYLILHQNLKAPKFGERYVKNGRFSWYIRGVVREAHILQKHLNRLGFNAGQVDGIIGPKTRGAILRLQKYLGIKPDGYIGPKIRALLNNSCGK